MWKPLPGPEILRGLRALVKAVSAVNAAKCERCNCDRSCSESKVRKQKEAPL